MIVIVLEEQEPCDCVNCKLVKAGFPRKPLLKIREMQELVDAFGQAHIKGLFREANGADGQRWARTGIEVCTDLIATVPIDLHPEVVEIREFLYKFC
mgnify:CR=1 FL=1